MTKLVANKPWILIIMGFFLLISVWVVFFIVALHNQPERLPLSQALLNAPPEIHTAQIPCLTSSFILHNSSFPSWT